MTAARFFSFFLFFLQIKKSDEMGYYVVATRDLKANEEIFTEYPSAIGCSHRRRQRIYCIGCNLKDEFFPKHGRLVQCPGCSWQACHEECPGLTDPLRHANECEVMKQLPLSDGDLRQVCQIFPIRCMLIQRDNPQLFAMMKEMGERALKERDPK